MGHGCVPLDGAYKAPLRQKGAAPNAAPFSCPLGRDVYELTRTGTGSRPYRWVLLS